MTAEMRYEELEHTADVRLKVYGADEVELFANAAFALFDRLVDLSAVSGTLREEVSAEGADSEETLVNFLGELLYRFEVEARVYRDFEITRLSATSICCTCIGEPFDPSRHERLTGIKAVTFHDVKIRREAGGLSVVITFDV